VRLRFALPAALAAIGLALVPASALADATVNTTANSGAGSLRDAVENVGGNIDFQPGLGPIQLTSPIVAHSEVDIADPEGDVTVEPSGGSVSPLIEFAAGSGNSSIAGVKFANGGGTGVQVDTGVSGVQVTRSPIFGVTTPLDLQGTANGSIAAPTNLRIGPRQADGTLPVTGNVASGSRVDLYAGDPAGATPTKFLSAPTPSGGAFSFVPSPELAPGTKVAATVTSGSGTSEYAVATVPSDVTSPTLKSAFAFTTNEVIVTPSEPLSGGSLNLSDFSLQMAGSPRQITSGAVSPDGMRVYLISSQPWNPGEAGALSLTRAGAIADAAGNANLTLSPVLVGAAPGDFSPPLVNTLKLSTSKVCLTKTRKCKKPGLTISFVTNEVGKAIVVINRASNRRAGQFVKKVTKAGTVKIKWRGTIHGRKLRAGSYVIEVSMQDNVGNVTSSPPFKKFRIVRSTP
jgi:hypothetical protein